jgi:hypothetical protein
MSADQLRLALGDHLALVRIVGAAARMGCRLVRVEADFGRPPCTLLVIEGSETSRRRLAAFAARVISIYQEEP